MGLIGLWNVKRRAQRAVHKFEFVVNNIRRERSGQNRVLKKSERLKKWLSVLYPPWKKEKSDGIYDQLFEDGTRANSIVILFRNILMIETFGIVMYLLLSFKYSQYPEFIGTSISTIIHVFLMFTLIFPKLMTYFMISIHVMMTTKIKNIILILLVTMAFEGPAMNVIGNIHQVASGVACVQIDVMSSRNDVEGNVMDKGAMLVARFRALLQNVAGPMNKVKNMLLVLDEKMTKFVDIMRRHYRVIASLSNQCRNMLQTPYTKCLNIFDDAYLFCKDKARFFGSHGDACDMIQKTAKVLSQICHQAKGFSTEVCSLPAVIGKGVKGAAVPFYSAYFQAIEFAVKKIFYVHIEAAKWALKKVNPVIEEIKKAKNIRAEYQSADDGKPNAADDTTANLRASVKKSLMNIVNVYIRIINVISFILRYCVMPCFLIWPFVYTLRFMYNYSYNDEFKNRFLTKEFYKIDQDCAFRGARKVMPLTPEEAKIYVSRGRWKMTEQEKPRFRLDIFITIITCVTPFFMCLLDYGTFTTLSTVHTLMNRTNIDTPAHYELKVAGNSSMSEVMNEFLDVFSPFTQSIRERETRWRRCFKEPNPPNYAENTLMFLMFIAALFLCRLKAYFGRQTLALADHFYPNRVRIRALSLYNKILQSRRNLLTEMLGNNKKDLMGGEDAIIRRSMQSRGYLSSDCAKCDKYDMKITDQENVRVCVHCSAFYCINCFCLNVFCVKCDEEMQNVNGIELYYEDDHEIMDDSG
ncbi:CRE-SPE-42 protein [Caenorhabditis remanei]|uniref:CRE-SPE-42 protein n=1 Tax=Caenorhabditis remanei TaxID=31234 RepID=E3LPQ3_CAERE|nr:CRE-SPE-42 protein [Caenorhabditis remanei]